MSPRGVLYFPFPSMSSAGSLAHHGSSVVSESADDLSPDDTPGKEARLGQTAMPQ